jgi:hypothetical protein
MLLVVACSGKDPYSPGTKLGTFHVTAALKSTSCGATPNPWEFDVRLNHDGPTLFWITGGAPIEGRVDDAARTQLRGSVVSEVRAADVKAKRDACSIGRTDVLALTLAGADAAPTSDPSLATSFGGSLIYTFAPTAGSDCSDQVTSAGGDFDALPCEVHYDLTGRFKSPAP